MTDATASAPPPHRLAPTPGRIALAFVFPLFFTLLFPLAFTSALHAPAPHDVPLLVVGPQQVVAEVADGLDGDRFDVDHTDAATAATDLVADRSYDGAIEITPVPQSDGSTAFEVTTVVAGAGGRALAATVQAVGAQVADEFGTTSDVVDVAPLASTDPLGTTLFYLFTYTSLAGYLIIIVLTQITPKARLRTRYLAVGGAAVAAPLIGFGLASIWVGDYHADFGTIAALLGVNALYVCTVGAIAILVQQFLGGGATLGVMAMIVLLNFPSAGGASPAGMLPPFWQGVHSVYFGAGAYESFRSIVYFDGAGVSRWLPQLLAWTVGAVLMTIVVHRTTQVRALRTELLASQDAPERTSARHRTAPIATAADRPLRLDAETAPAGAPDTTLDDRIRTGDAR